MRLPLNPRRRARGGRGPRDHRVLRPLLLGTVGLGDGLEHWWGLRRRRRGRRRLRGGCAPHLQWGQAARVRRPLEDRLLLAHKVV